MFAKHLLINYPYFHRMKKFLIPIALTALIATGAIIVKLNQNNNHNKEVLSPLAKTNKESAFKKQLSKLTSTETEPEPEFNTDLAKKDISNILLLGIDRRSKDEAGYRTDIMILLTINKKDNRVVLTSLPRDLWYRGGRINAIYVQNGWEGMQQAFETITKQKPDKYILTDFEDFSWIVDQMGGVPVNITTTFTDSQYPVDATKEYQTVSFTAGPERLTGERALIFSRSRKGDNDNGDWGRMRRQHLILKGMLEAVVQPQSFICKNTENATENVGMCETKVNKNTLEYALKMVTSGRMSTNLALEDLEYLWDFYKDKDKYVIESLLMDYEYVFTPPAEEYGGAWVLAPIGNDYTKFQTTLNNMIYGIATQNVENVEPDIETPAL